MKNSITVSIYVLIVICFSACCKEEAEDPIALGNITVDLDASKPTVRTKEALIGNMICDAVKSDAGRRGKVVDFSIMNGGGIRFNEQSRPSGIYPAGLFTSDMIEEMLPFGNASVVVKVTGKELKSIFERSVAQLPVAKGPFLQVSKELKIIIDTTKPPQIINDLVEPNIIVSNGSRIISIKINNVEYDSLATYTLVTSDFIAEGNDGYVTFKNISPDKKENLGDDQSGAVKEYIILNTPVTPIIEGRIIYQ